jgi:hypothetical protein
MDHAGALGHSDNAIDCTWRRREGKGAGEEFGEGVGRTYRSGSLQPVLVRRSEL